MLKGGRQMTNGGGGETFHSNIVFNTAHRSIHCRFSDTFNWETPAHETYLVRSNRFQCLESTCHKNGTTLFSFIFHARCLSKELVCAEKRKRKRKSNYANGGSNMENAWDAPLEKVSHARQQDACLYKFYFTTVCNICSNKILTTLFFVSSPKQLKKKISSKQNETASRLAASGTRWRSTKISSFICVNAHIWSWIDSLLSSQSVSVATTDFKANATLSHFSVWRARSSVCFYA